MGEHRQKLILAPVALFQLDLNDPDKLNGKIVVASHRKHGLLLGRFRRVNGMQMLESDNREYGPLVLGKGRDWRILGKVLWLFRQTP